MATRRIFWGCCINRFGIGPLHYISSRSDFGFEFAEIFVIERRLPDSPSVFLFSIYVIYSNPTRRVWCKGSMRNQFLKKPQKIRLIAMSLSTIKYKHWIERSRGSDGLPSPPLPSRIESRSYSQELCSINGWRHLHSAPPWLITSCQGKYTVQYRIQSKNRCILKFSF